MTDRVLLVIAAVLLLLVSLRCLWLQWKLSRRDEQASFRITGRGE